SCGIDQSVLGMPIMASPQGIIYQHETTNDADGAPLVPLMQTGYWKISEGEVLGFIDWFRPDFKWDLFPNSGSAPIQITLLGVDYAGDTPTQFGPYTVTRSTPYFNPRLRKRFVAMQATSSDVGSWWRLGAPEYRFNPDGRR